MAGHHVVLAVGNTVNLVVPAVVGGYVIGRRADHDIACHLRMDIAKQCRGPGLVELERTLLALRPGSKILARQLFRRLLDGRPKDIMSYIVAVVKIDRGALQNDRNVRLEENALLVDHRMLRWCREGLAGDGVNIDDGLAGDSGNFSADAAGTG